MMEKLQVITPSKPVQTQSWTELAHPVQSYIGLGAVGRGLPLPVGSHIFHHAACRPALPISRPARLGTIVPLQTLLSGAADEQ